MGTITWLREKRRGQRVSCVVKDLHGRSISNLSKNGAYLECHDKYEVGQFLLIGFIMNHAKEVVTIPARVVRSSKIEVDWFGYGLSFEENLETDPKLIKGFSLHHPIENTDYLGSQNEKTFRVFHRTIRIETPEKIPSTFDLTKQSQQIVIESGIAFGSLIMQALSKSTFLYTHFHDINSPEPMTLRNHNLSLIVRNQQLLLGKGQQVVVVQSGMRCPIEIAVEVNGINR